MSILDNNNDRVVPQIPRGKMAANRLIQMTRQTYNQIVQSFNQGAKIFWQNGAGASPSEIASELGTDAKEIFELHYKLGQLIASIRPEVIAYSISIIGNFTMNDDGTVTVVEQPTVPSEE